VSPIGNNAILQFVVDQEAFEEDRYEDADGVTRAWAHASVRDGGSDLHELYQVDSAGNIFATEVGTEDEEEPIPISATTKRYALDGISMLHDLYVRLEAVTADTLSFEVRAGGSEYGEIAYDYEVDCSGSGDLERRIRLHRELLGVWASVTLTGSVSNRPEVRELTLRYVPFRGGRASA
jgi:hypothetical protein